jgi:hypothetical protein
MGIFTALINKYTNTFRSRPRAAPVDSSALLFIFVVISYAIDWNFYLNLMHDVQLKRRKKLSGFHRKYV